MLGLSLALFGVRFSHSIQPKRSGTGLVNCIIRFVEQNMNIIYSLKRNTIEDDVDFRKMICHVNLVGNPPSKISDLA